MSDNIPPEVISHILCHLPVKSLLRFRCVCKSWKSLIDSSKFIKDHLNKQLITKPNSDMILILKGNTLYSLDFSSVCSRNVTPLELKHPLETPYDPTRVLGSCHGLVYICNNMDDSGVVWNPSTRNFLHLPVYQIKPPPEFQQQVAQQGESGQGLCLFIGGFGYDAASDDYKAVRIVQWVLDGSVITDTFVFSLKSGVWKKVEQSFTDQLGAEGDGTFVGGVLHWIASSGPDNTLILIGFSLGTERYEQVPFPENFGDNPVKLNLAVLGEQLCLLEGIVRRVSSSARNLVLDRVDVWVMKEYGVKDSWVKLFSVDQLDGHSHFKCVRPVAYSVVSCREVLLKMDTKRFFWYDIDKKLLKPVRMSGGLDSFETHVCLGTLVPVDGGGNEKDGKKKGEQEDLAEMLKRMEMSLNLMFNGVVLLS